MSKDSVGDVARFGDTDGGVSVRRAQATSARARRWIGPKGARAQLRGRPISEKALVILECKEAFANTELSPLNA